MGMKEIPKTLKELEVWSINYEKAHMKWHPSNTLVANASLPILSSSMPCFMKSGVKIVALSMFDDELIKALYGKAWKDNSSYWRKIIGGLMHQLLRARGLFVHLLLFPRQEKDRLLRTLVREEEMTVLSGCPFSGKARRLPFYHINVSYDLYKHGYDVNTIGAADS